MAPNRRSGPSSSNNNENPDVATVIAQQLQAIITQVANNANNANNGNNGGGNGNEGNNGCSYKTFQSCNPKEYDGKGGAITLTRWIEKMENVIDNSGCAREPKSNLLLAHWEISFKLVETSNVKQEGDVAALAMSYEFTLRHMMDERVLPKYEMRITPETQSRIKEYILSLAPEIRGMLRATQPDTIQTAILRAGILTDEAVSCGTLTKGSEKRKVMEEPSNNTIYCSCGK
ncbi:hypothetical protein Tco_1294850 [Tanacetum coccineum]